MTHSPQMDQSHAPSSSSGPWNQDSNTERNSSPSSSEVGPDPEPRVTVATQIPNGSEDVIVILSSDEDTETSATGSSQGRGSRASNSTLHHRQVHLSGSSHPSASASASSSSTVSRQSLAPQTPSREQSAGITSSRIPMIDLTSDLDEAIPASDQVYPVQETGDEDADVMVTGERRINSWRSAADPHQSTSTLHASNERSHTRWRSENEHRRPGELRFPELRSSSRIPQISSIGGAIASWFHLNPREPSSSDSHAGGSRPRRHTPLRRSPRLQLTDRHYSSRTLHPNLQPYTFHSRNHGASMHSGGQSGDSDRPFLTFPGLDDDFPMPYPPFSLMMDQYEDEPYGEIPPLLTAALSRLHSSVDAMNRRNEELDQTRERRIEAELDRERAALPPPIPGFTDHSGEGEGREEGDSAPWLCTQCNRDFMGKEPMPEEAEPQSVKRRRMLKDKGSSVERKKKVNDDSGATMEEGSSGTDAPTLFDAHGIWAPKCGHMVCGECVKLVRYHRVKGGWKCRACQEKLSGKGFRQLFTM